jgi:hypothetical protein
MSHVVAIKTEVTDLKALAAAVAELGGELLEGVKKGRWFGKWVNDYSAADAAYKLGIKTEDYGKCDAVIRFKDSAYDIMLLKNPETNGYRIYWDFYGQNGKSLEDHVGGRDARKLIQLYGVNKATLEAKSRGYGVKREVKTNGAIKLTLFGRFVRRATLAK